MQYERPQRGNPHQLTLNQHCFPRASIARFTASDERVDVRLIEQQKNVRLKPDHPVFCARRVWDQKAESGYMRDIENRYQNLAHDISRGNVTRRLKPNEQLVVTDMYALWNIRWHYSSRPLPNQPLRGVIGLAHEYSEDDIELLEKHGVTAVRDDLTVAGRHFRGQHVRQNLASVREEMRGVQWGILKSRQGEFAIGDNSSDTYVLPVNPTLCLVGQPGYRLIQQPDLIRLNRQAVQISKAYYFARSFGACLGLSGSETEQ